MVALQILGCKDSVSPPQSAAISVTVHVAGLYPFDGFQIQVDGRAMTLLKSEASLVVRGLSLGSHTVSVVGLPSTCHSDGANPATVQTSSADLSAVEFHVSCFTTDGAIALAVTLTGYSRQLWFKAQVDSSVSNAAVRGNATTVLFGTFPGGPHVIRLSGIPTFCEPAGEQSTSVDVKTGTVTQDTALANFSIHCNPPEPGADTAASIVFERGGYVMLVRESGGSPVALTEGTSPAWSPDGELIAFHKSNCYVNQGCERDLWLTTPGGSSQWPVTVDPNFDDYDAAFSPNANSIAFIRFWLGPDQSYLVVSDLQGGSLKILSIWNPVYTPSWSPDGAQIAFVCEGVVWSGSLDICLVHTDKGCDSYFPSRCNLPLTPLTTRLGDELDPAWSPDGGRIAFTLACGFQSVCPDSITTAEPYIAVIDLVTREVTRLVAGHDPAWSPDGSHLVFVGNASSPGLRVYKFADGSVRQLTDNPADKSPSWRQ